MKWPKLGLFVCLTAFLCGFGTRNSHADCDSALLPSYTSNLGLLLPQINSCSWGLATNSNWAILDSSVAILSKSNTFSGPNTIFNYGISLSSITATGNVTLSNLASGQCVQTGTGGLLTVTGSACGSGGGGGSIILPASIAYTTSTVAFTAAQTFTSSVTVTSTFGVVGMSGPVQTDNSGSINLKQLVYGDGLVIVSSYTDSQLGSADLLILDRNINRNDPIIRVFKNANNSSPEMRWDSPAPNMEVIATSTDNTHGLGKWEPFAVANQGVDLQVNNRAWSNNTFETLAYWHPLSKLDIMPGLYLNPQNVTDDSGIITSSDTAGIHFFTLNAHTVGLTAPQNPSVSYVFGLPSTVGSQGQVMFQNGNRGGNFNVRQMDWTVGGSSQQVLTNGGTGVPYWSTISGGGSLIYPATSTPSFPYGLTSSSASFIGPLQSTFTYGLSVGSLTVTGSGAGTIIGTEGAAPTGVSGSDVLWSDSGSHHWTTIDNNTSTATLVTSSSPITAGQCAGWSATGQVISQACGSGGSISLPSTIAYTTSTVAFTVPQTVTASFTVTGPGIIYTSSSPVIMGTNTATTATAQLEVIGNSNNTNIIAFSTSPFGSSLMTISTIPATAPSDFELKLTSSPAVQTVLFGVQQSGHVISSGTIPVIGSCGTSPSIALGSTDFAGTINTGSGSPTTCAITFANTFTTVPVCVATDDLQTVEVSITSRSATGLTFTMSAALNSGHIFFMCVGNQ